MNILFVGVKREYSKLDKDYINFFNQFHLELPYYYAKYSGERIDVLITTVDYTQNDCDVISFNTDNYDTHSTLRCVSEEVYKNGPSFKHWIPDVVIHWRKWFEEFYDPDAINLINCQDHSFSQQWQDSASKAFQDKKLYGILCFPTWHKRNLLNECKWLNEERAIDGVTLGVDTDIYTPESKDPFKLLWASDPGRGLWNMKNIIESLSKLDNRFKLHICYPDYVNDVYSFESWPNTLVHRNMKNGPALWKLFNTSAFLPYASDFMEPSSRSHRQAQAAGCMVLYPPGKGSPSELIESNQTGIVEPIDKWPMIIFKNAYSGNFSKIGKNARELALNENWEVQALRFIKLAKSIQEKMK